MSANVFVSYPYKDARSLRGELETWERRGLLGKVTLIAETEDNREAGTEPIKRHLREKMASCRAVLMLVGDNCHNRPWLDYEAAVAQSAGTYIALVRIPGTTGAAPQRLRGMPLLPWSATAISAALRELLR